MSIFKAVRLIEVLDMAEPIAGFEECLRAFRDQEGLSQTEWGQRAGLHCTYIGRLERWLSGPTPPF
jgi:hypothetical protein